MNDLTSTERLGILASGEPIYLRLDSKQRRLLLLLISMSLIALWSAILLPAKQKGFAAIPVDEWVKLVSMCLSFLLLVSPIIVYALCSHVRINGSGIAVRGSLGWQLIPWNAFSAGQVHAKGNFDRFYCDKKELLLNVLSREDRSLVQSIIRRIWRAPPCENAPARASEALIVELYAPGERAHFHGQGIQFHDWSGDHFFRWTEVQQLRVFREAHTSDDFRRLEFMMGKYKFTIGPKVKSIIDPSDHSIVERRELMTLLCALLRPEQVLMIAANGPPQSNEERNYRLEYIDRALRAHFGMKLTVLAASVLIVGAFAWARFNAQGWDWLFWSLLLASAALLSKLIFSWGLNVGELAMQQQKSELEGWEPKGNRCCPE